MDESIGSINSSLQLQAESISVSAKHMWFLLGLYCRQQLCYCSCSNKYRMLLSRSGRSIQSLCTQNIYPTHCVDVVLYCAQSKCTRNAKTSTSSKTVLFLLTVSYLYSIVYYYLYIILYIHHNIV